MVPAHFIISMGKDDRSGKCHLPFFDWTLVRILTSVKEQGLFYDHFPAEVFCDSTVFSKDYYGG